MASFDCLVDSLDTLVFSASILVFSALTLAFSACTRAASASLTAASVASTAALAANASAAASNEGCLSDCIHSASVPTKPLLTATSYADQPCIPCIPDKSTMNFHPLLVLRYTLASSGSSTLPVLIITYSPIFTSVVPRSASIASTEGYSFLYVNASPIA